MEDIKEVKIHTKEWANPTPAGLVALAVACFCFFALLNGYIEKTALPIMACWLIGGFVIQIAVGLLDLKAGSSTGGNTFLFFCAFFMLATGLGMLFKYFYAPDIDARVDGYAWLALSMVVMLWTPAFFKPMGLLTIIVLTLDIALPIIALNDLGLLTGAVQDVLVAIAAYVLLGAGIIAIYLSSALVVNKAFGREVYPLFQKK